MDKLFNCRYCSYTTIYLPHYRAHMQTHVDDEQFTRTHNSQASTHNKRQKRQSVCENPFKCTECSYASTDHGQLLRHCTTAHGKMRRVSGFKPAFVPFEMYTTEKLRALDNPKGIPPGAIANNSRISPKASVIDTESVATSAFNSTAVSSYSSPNKKCPPEKEIDQIEDDNCSIGMNPVMKPIARNRAEGFKPVLVPTSKTNSTVHLRALGNPKGISYGKIAINSRKNSQANVSESIHDIECIGINLTPATNHLPKKKISQTDDDNCSINMNSGTNLIACNTVNLSANQSMRTDKWCADNLLNGKDYTNRYADALITVDQSVVDSAPILLTTLTPMGIYNSALHNTNRLSEREIGQVDVDNCIADMYSGMNPALSNIVGENFRGVEYTEDDYFHWDNDENSYMESTEDYNRIRSRGALISNRYNIYRYL